METMRRTLLLLALAATGLWAQRAWTVQQLQTFINSSIELKQSDKQVADILKEIRLTQRLTPGAVEDLQAMGVGPRTLDALKVLSAASSGMGAAPPQAPAAPGPKPLPPPSDAEQKKVLAEVTKNALDYTKNLPNFICTQVTRRYNGLPGERGWRIYDTVQEQLSFSDGKEDYKVVLRNNLPVTNITHEQLGGTISRGEFGTRLNEIFRPESKAEIAWDHWATLRGRRMDVYNYRVLQKNSDYLIQDIPSGREMVGGYHGAFYADAETKNVMRIVMDVDGLENFPVRKIDMTLDYDLIDISGRDFVLPLRFELTSDSPQGSSRNDVQFRRYNKFTADATIIVDPEDEIPADQLKEQPAK